MKKIEMEAETMIVYLIRLVKYDSEMIIWRKTNSIINMITD
jgi:hypothetical protein